MIFVDTGFFFAFFSEKDPDHSRCSDVFDTFEGHRLPELLITTDHVVFETITLARRRIGHERAAFVGERLYSEKIARIHRVSSTSNALPSSTSSGTRTRSTAW